MSNTTNNCFCLTCKRVSQENPQPYIVKITEDLNPKEVKGWFSNSLCMSCAVIAHIDNRKELNFAVEAAEKQLGISQEYKKYGYQ